MADSHVTNKNQTSEIYMLNGEEQMEFDEVAVYFSEEEWVCLTEEQKELYKDVMIENYWTLRSLGYVHVKPLLVTKIEHREQPYLCSFPITKDDVKTEVTLKAEQTDDLYIEKLEVVKQEIEDNISTGYVKTEVTLNAEHTDDLYIEKLEAVKQEISDDIITGTITNCSYPVYGQSADASFNRFQNQRTHLANLCSECGKCFTKKSHLNRHQKIHTQEKAFSCLECGKCFNQKSNLLGHLNIHTGQKVYSCSLCGKDFTFKSNLNRHQKVHSGQKAFSCSECGKCFTYNSNLISHRKIHTGQKEFSCSECGKCFTKKSNLISHLKVH
ncbi:zinc finger protein 383-like [Bombina bombina]|uniref:zinc finger protein 383-like n=1 Tax=Bombina bombina TaxID=8345 RepID=UPI00235A99B1|nr:zinc finger protein 383-like [Bombina bombina]XP_053577511.1 zinc finger protein 383-like [Bombina bombina]